MSATRITTASGVELANNVSGSPNDGEQHMSFYVGALISKWMAGHMCALYNAAGASQRQACVAS